LGLTQGRHFFCDAFYIVEYFLINDSTARGGEITKALRFVKINAVPK
jgi:hypothetical protein